MVTFEPGFHMWATFAFTLVLITLYIWERLPIILASTLCLGAMALTFHAFPLIGPNGTNLLDPHRLLAGFGNPALVTVLSLIIIGRALVLTGALSQLTNVVLAAGHNRSFLAVITILTCVTVTTAFLNNTPVVVMFIPIMLALAARTQRSPSTIMMPLSYAAILGGMTTLIGSSTNLLVSRSLVELGQTPFTFFEFTPFGVILAGLGLVYVFFLMPVLLRHRGGPNVALSNRGARQFLAHLTLKEESPLIGIKPVAGHFKELPDIVVMMIWRNRRAILPPFDETPLQAGDMLVIAATRQVLTDATMHRFGLIAADDDLKMRTGPGGTAPSAHRQVVEAMVAPGGDLTGATIRNSHFLRRFGCVVIGLQRRAHMIRTRMTEIPLEPGDVLLLYGTHEAVNALQSSRGLVVLDQSSEDMPAYHHSRRALAVFAGVVLLATTNIFPIAILALTGAALMILLKAIRLQQALRSIDFNLVFIIATSLALGAALELTGGATYLAQQIIMGLDQAGPAVMLSVFFLLVAIFTNLISNNACAVLFTPIGVHIAFDIGVDPHIFAIAALFAANCSFCTPIGYQTNLLVMGPGHYRFSDYLYLGIPLMLLIWLAFSFLAPVIYDL